MVDQQSGFLLLIFCCFAIKAETPPSIFTATRTPDNFRDGGSVTLHCQASGDSPLTYQWFAFDFNGNSKDISGSRYNHQSSIGRLTISNLQHAQDDGNFYCVAMNAAGRVRSDRVLIQVSYLETTPNSGGSSITVFEGGALRYTYPGVNSFPHPSFIWRKGGSAISETQRISFSKAGNLYIGNVVRNDLAHYTSTVQNTVAGQSFNRGPLTVSVTARDSGQIPAQVEIILSPINQVAVSGKTASVTFECFGSGRPMPTISWTKNGQTISSSSKYSFDAYKKRFTIHNPVKADEGNYVCNMNSGSSPSPRTSTANLTVFVEPTFTVTPTNADKLPQQSVIFACSASGTPQPTITWFHNGAKVPPSPTGRVQINSNNELRFTSLQSGDKGTVQCVATNDGGEKISKATLRVRPLPVWIDIPPKDTFALVNDTVELDCKGRGDPTPTITWKKNDQPIDFANNPRYFQKSTGSLQISRSQKSDSGKYTCEATNRMGSKWANATLTVLIKTVITNPLPSQISAIKGLLKDLPCGVQADPAITVLWSWTKDGSSVDAARMKLQNDGTLRILTVQEKDAGTYVCIVQSVGGNATTSGTLSVQETPLAPSTPVVSNIQPTSVRLTWLPPGYDGNSPILSYIVEARKGSNGWQRQMDNINPSSQQVSVLVRNLQPHTQYQFRVRAENQVGVGAPSAASGSILTLIAAPSQAPLNVNGVPTSADSVLVQWQIPPPESHNGPLRGFKIAYRLSGVVGVAFIVKKIANPAATQGNIDGLVQFTGYDIKVLAYNDAGDGAYSNPITVTTAEGVPTAPPQDVTVINISSVSVVLQWKPPPQKQQNGRIRGYKLQAWKGNTPSNIVQNVADHDGSVIIQRGTLSGLQKFTQYTVGIIAYNGAGDSPRSDTKIIKTEEGVPDAPRSFTVSEVYSDALKVSWDRPLNVNGLLVAYLVKHWMNDTSPSNGHTTRLPNTTLSHTVTGLRANTVYSVELSAQTRAGIGTSKTLSARTTQSPVIPGAPHNLRVIEAKARSVVINFTPGSSGRAPILSYTIEFNNESFYDPATARWRVLMAVQDAHLVWDLLPLTLPHLKPYTDYRFRVTAANKIGRSSPSNASDTIKTLEAAPSLPPSDLNVIQIGRDGLELRWKIPPRDTWNSDFIGFLMRYEPQGVNKTIHTLEIKIPNSQLNYYRAGGLLKYKRYRVSVRTYNLNGLGVSSGSAVAWAWTQEDAPSRAPTDLTAVVTGASSVTVSWGQVPLVEQNGEILGYKIYYSVYGRQNTEREKQVNHGLTFSTSLTGLESYVMYEFQILAYTRIGPGPRSLPVRATTLESTPGPPARVRFIDVGAVSVTIAWDTPVYPRGIITEYKALCRLNSSSVGVVWQANSIGPSVRQRVAGPLKTQTYYRFFVWAKTKKGFSETPAEAVVYTGGSTDPPDAPFILPIYFSDIGERWIKVRWYTTTDPQSPLRYFTLQLNRNGQGWQVYSSDVHHSARSLKVEGLLPGETYVFRIMATNDRGNSPYSAASTPTTTRLALPTGAPRDVRIRVSSPTSLLVEWTSPLPQELGGTLKGFIVQYREQISGVSGFTEVSLPASARQYTLQNMRVFALYGIRVAAVNEKGPGPYTPVYNVTTGERPPSVPPSNLKKGGVTKTSIAISWVAPPLESLHGHLMGYKVYAEDLSLSSETSRRRRRSLQVSSQKHKRSPFHGRSRFRRSLPLCLREPGPKIMFVPPHLTTANMTNLRKFVTYRIWVRAYNSIGESPPSASMEVTTRAGRPGPPAAFHEVAVYNARVDLFWKPPCEPSGKIIQYEIKYGPTSTNNVQRVLVSADRETKQINGLAMLTNYSFELRTENSMGYGPPRKFVVRTKGPATLPGQPGRPVVHPGSITAVVMWENGDSGNVPFLKFEIQSQTDASPDFETHWEASPDETKRNNSYVYYTVGNLQPKTGYRFKIIAWNEVGRSNASLASDKVFTGDPIGSEAKQVYYKRWWFILLMVLFGLCLIFLIAGFIFICYRRRKDEEEHVSSTGVSTTQSTLERMRTASRNGTIRSGTLPSVQITYRDTEPAHDELSSVGSKDELSDDSDSGVSEVTYKRKASDLSFVNHSADNSNRTAWRDSLSRPRVPQGRRDRNLIGHTTEESDAPDEAPMTRGLKSFSVMSLPRDQRDGPPSYDDRRYMAKSADHLDRIQRPELPPEAVTSFMSRDYEDKQKYTGYRGQGKPYSPYRASRPVGPMRRSRDQIDDDNDDSSSPPASPTRPNYGNFSHSPKIEPQRRSKRQPRSGSFRRALESDGNPRDSDGSSKYSDRASSSSNDHRDTRTLVEPSGNPRIQYDEEPGRRTRPKLAVLYAPGNQSRHRVPPSPSSRLRAPPSPSTPVSPAPSYHTVDPVYGGRISPVHSHGSSRDAGLSDHSDGRNPPVMYLDMNAHSNENYQSSEPHISSYSSFV